MRPQDIVILLKMICKRDAQWQYKDLAAELFLSPAEITLSMRRNLLAGLITPDKKRVHKQTLLEFIQYGLHVVFPVVPGGIVNGMYTAHSHPFMQQHFAGENAFVWPDITGNGRGQSIMPLYKDVIKACRQDEDLYKMLALLDVVRAGKTREIKLAVDEIKKSINEPAYKYSQA